MKHPKLPLHRILCLSLCFLGAGAILSAGEPAKAIAVSPAGSQGAVWSDSSELDTLQLKTDLVMNGERYNVVLTSGSRKAAADAFRSQGYVATTKDESIALVSELRSSLESRMKSAMRGHSMKVSAVFLRREQPKAGSAGTAASQSGAVQNPDISWIDRLEKPGDLPAALLVRPIAIGQARFNVIAFTDGFENEIVSGYAKEHGYVAATPDEKIAFERTLSTDLHKRLDWAANTIGAHGIMYVVVRELPKAATVASLQTGR